MAHFQAGREAQSRAGRQAGLRHCIHKTYTLHHNGGKATEALLMTRVLNMLPVHPC
jgi:hypothetical protein